MARQAARYMRDERLLVEDSFLLLKPTTVARQVGDCIRDERLQVQDTILLLKKYHCGKAGRTLHEGREVTS